MMGSSLRLNQSLWRRGGGTHPIPGTSAAASHPEHGNYHQLRRGCACLRFPLCLPCLYCQSRLGRACMDPWSLNSGHWAPTLLPALHLQAFACFPKPTDLCFVSPLRALPPGPGHVSFVSSPWNPRAFVPDPRAPWAIDAKVRWNQPLLLSRIRLSRSCNLSFIMVRTRQYHTSTFSLMVLCWRAQKE